MHHLSVADIGMYGLFLGCGALTGAHRGLSVGAAECGKGPLWLVAAFAHHMHLRHTHLVWFRCLPPSLCCGPSLRNYSFFLC